MRGYIYQSKPEQSKSVKPTATGFTVSPDTGKTLSSVVISGDSNLKAEHIKSNVEIFGISGTYPLSLKSITIATNNSQFRWATHNSTVQTITVEVGINLPQLQYNGSSDSAYCNPKITYNY